MSNFLPQLVSPTALLYIYLTLTQFAYGVYFASDIEPLPGFNSLYPLGLLWLLGWWLLRDSRKRGIPWVFDMGMFLYIAWPFIMPYYLVKTRGAKGLLMILGFIAVYVGALVVGMGIYLLLVPPT